MIWGKAYPNLRVFLKSIEERFNFSLIGINKKNITETKRALRNEKYNLIRFGYNKSLVRESFLDVMKGLYGNDETNVLSDIKTRLGQRIADQVKNKQEEQGRTYFIDEDLYI